MKRAVLDASAVIFLLEDRPGGEIVEELLAEGLAGRAELFMSVVNWGEVFYSTWKAHGPGYAQQALGEISHLPIEIVPADTDLTRFAAELRATHDLPYADCFAAALSKKWKAELVTSDRHFLKVGSQIELNFL